MTTPIASKVRTLSLETKLSVTRHRACTNGLDMTFNCIADNMLTFLVTERLRAAGYISLLGTR